MNVCLGGDDLPARLGPPPVTYDSAGQPSVSTQRPPARPAEHAQAAQRSSASTSPSPTRGLGPPSADPTADAAAASPAAAIVAADHQDLTDRCPWRCFRAARPCNFTARPGGPRPHRDRDDEARAIIARAPTAATRAGRSGAGSRTESGARGGGRGAVPGRDLRRAGLSQRPGEDPGELRRLPMP